MPGARETFATVGGILAAALRDLLVEHGVECLLLGGQISRSFAHMEAALRDGLRDVAGLTRIAPAEHIGEAALLRTAGPGGRRLLTCGRCGKPFIRAIVPEPAGMSKYLIVFIFLSLQERRLPLLFSNRRDHD